MELQEYLIENKDLYNNLLDFLQSESILTDDFQILIQNNENNQIDLKFVLHILSDISENHHRHQFLIQNIEQIILSIQNEIKQTFTNFQIFNIFRNSKRILFFLFKNEIITPDESIVYFMIKNYNHSYCSFFYPEIKSIFDQKIIQSPVDFTSKLEKEFSLNFEDQQFSLSFEENRQRGENDSYISSLIRNDSVEEFITHINKNNISFTSHIKQSIYETNSFLINKEPSLIEYAAFFGSIEIFKFLQLNNVELNSSLWLYVIHGNNADLIHLLEDNHIDPNEDKSFLECLEESIKCHHNDIANYILINKMNEIQLLQEFDHNQIAYGFHYHNYAFLPDDYDKQIIFYYSCEYDYLPLVEILVNDKEIDINAKLTNSNITALFLAGNNDRTETIDFLFSQPEIEIGNNCFKNCVGLTKINLPQNLTAISNTMFSGCSNLKQITIPTSVTEINDFSFNKCSSLKEIEIPESVKLIGEYCFRECTSLEKVTILSKECIKIKYSAFEECISLASIIIPSTLTKIENFTFLKCCSLTQIIIPSSVTYIGENAFGQCAHLKEVILPSTLDTIKSCVFYKCSSLKEITIPPNVNSIEINCFNSCNSLKRVEFASPSHLKSIKKSAFYCCKSLVEITIPSSVTIIDESAFDCCESLIEITIPSSVTIIDKYAFDRCTSLKQVLFETPSNLETISNNSFYQCTSLIKISIPASVTYIGDSAFKFCSSMTEVMFDEKSSLNKIGNYAFASCSSLVQINIPSSVTDLGFNTFNECWALKNPNSENSTRKCIIN